MDNIREKLVELLKKADRYEFEEQRKRCDFSIQEGWLLIADYLIANNVTVQEMAYWTDVMDCGVGNCFGHCSNCHTPHKANSYAELVAGRRYCKWCGAKLLPPKGE